MTEEMTGEPVLHGVQVEQLGAEQTREVLDQVLGGRRCTALGDESEQWLIAEFGDGRLTGRCPTGDQQWHLAFTGPSKLQPVGYADTWKLLELTVFTEQAQIRIGEGAKCAHHATETEDWRELVEWLKPRERWLLLLGWYQKPPNDQGRVCVKSLTSGMARAEELSGSVVLHPVSAEDWEDFSTDPPKGSPEKTVSVGTWLRVREYWAQDPTTGAVHVAYHRLAGYETGGKPKEVQA